MVFNWFILFADACSVWYTCTCMKLGKSAAHVYNG